VILRGLPPENPNPICYIGIDPGLSGALARIVPSAGIAEAVPLPTLSDGTRRFLDLMAIREILTGWISGTSPSVLLERAQPMPRDGPVGAFRYGEVYGALKAVLACLEIPFETVHPATWKARMLESKGKDAARILATQLFPQKEALFRPKNSHNMAEALLLAEYSKRIFQHPAPQKESKTTRQIRKTKM